MDTVKYVKLASWHIVSGYSRSSRALTLCGRAADDGVLTMREFPADERTCESCFRIAARKVPAIRSPREGS